MGKLVRDRIPDIIRRRGGTAAIRRLDRESYRAALLDKLVEEATELREAAAADVLDECADVYEVLLTIAAVDGLGLDTIENRAAAKRETNGGFAERLFLESFT